MSATLTKDAINVRSELEGLRGQNRFGAGWQDLIATLTNSNASGISPPTWKAMGSNGNYGLRFTAGDSAFAIFHVPHDWKFGTLAYPHIHFLVDIALTAGDTITWKLIYSIAKGHQQGESMIGPRTTITLTYTANGTEIAGEHIILECTEADAVDMREVDALACFEVEMDAASVTGAEEIFGLMCDLHYESDGMLTSEKAPEFTKNA